MKYFLPIIAVALCAACSKITVTSGDSVSAAELDSFFRKHKVDGNRAVAIKKHSGGDMYLATIRGYPNNLSVCEQLIAPYNKDPSLSAMPGRYYCEVLR